MPLVDVMLVLLIIFMVAAPMMQHGLDVNLPGVAAGAGDLVRADLRDGPVDLHARTARPAQRRATSGWTSSPERIRQALQGQENKEVFLAGDAGVTLQSLMDVMDRLKQGGVEKVGIVARAQAKNER